jgi:hypothetical protein
MAKPTWTARGFTELDKSIDVDGPLSLRVDYDDVDQAQVKRDLKRMLSILNRHWDDPENQEVT